MKRTLLHLAFLALPLAAMAHPTGDQHYHNPVIPGDYPDPSIVRVGDTYYAVATTSDWGPQFSVLTSKDLVNWTAGPAIFPNRPQWAVGKFWAPEIVHHNGKFFIYYTAEKRDGPLSVAVASANKIEGPWTDHGAIISQKVGSIDAFPIDDPVTGERYLVWKEDANSVSQPTPLWAQRLGADGYTLQGEPFEIMRNTEAWEGPLIEGPFIHRRGEYLYMFYSGNACCGNGCKYAVGVARSKSVKGPWEKYSKNPILAGNDIFRCPGHGSIVTDQKGRDYFFYHAVSQTDGIFVGRQAMLDQVTWGADGWPSINGGRGASGTAPAPYPGTEQRFTQKSHSDNFSGPLEMGWAWPQANAPVVKMERGGLLLTPGKDAPADGPVQAVLGRSTTAGDYSAEVTVWPGGGQGGLAAFGNKENAVGVALGGGKLRLWEIIAGKPSVRLEEPFSGDNARLKMDVDDGHHYRFFVWKGDRYVPFGPEVERADLPPWDLGVRVALTAGGAAGALFKDFTTGARPW